jgi:4-hydroxy-2-oxoheptanedioate aldolase
MYDYIEFSAEYVPFDLYALDNICRAAELHGMSSMIKVDAEPRTFLTQRGIGSGFHSVLFADPRSADEVRQCVRLARPDTPEDGGLYGSEMRRSTFVGLPNSIGSPLTPEYLQYIRDIVVVPMIEKKEAVEQLEEILEIDGVDMIQWGPGDYSMSVGKDHDSPEIKATGRLVTETAIKMGVPPRAEIETADEAKYWLDMGVRHFCVGFETDILYNWWRENGDKLRKALEGA